MSVATGVWWPEVTGRGYWKMVYGLGGLRCLCVSVIRDRMRTNFLLRGGHVFIVELSLNA